MMQINLENKAQVKILLFLVNERLEKNIVNIDTTDDLLLVEYYRNQNAEIEKIQNQLEKCYE